MRTVAVGLAERAYPIHIGSGLLADPPGIEAFRKRRLKIVTDANVAPHYLAPLLRALALRPEDALVLPAGEAQKTLASAERVLDWLLAARLPRDGCLVALGGGVVGDLVGFAAAIYQRGVDFIQVPTTLLAQVDSSVGGKTGVNHPRGKNMIGAFHQPRLVVADLDTLRTLPPRELLAGLAEVVKYGMLGDAQLFAWLEKTLDWLLALDANALAKAVEQCCTMKARIVALDERESGPRALLNLGHTFGHAIETHTGYTQWLHGEAVAVGLCMAADLSARLGWIAAEAADRCLGLLGRAGLPTQLPPGMTPARFMELMGLDKKVQGGRLRLVLLKAVGQAVVTSDFDAVKLQETLEHFCAASSSR
ncbi:MAG: 3-dehydroquinate synthase [Gammaproteobacteria bacterium]|nr:3-dehydroquinate synthase [Gammaproteobacteria bacterium]